MKQITSREEIPVNMTDEESAVFWGSHSMSSELLEASLTQDNLPRRSGPKIGFKNKNRDG